MRFVFWVALVAAAIWYFKPFSTSQVSIEEFVKQQDTILIGSTPDVWLTKKGSLDYYTRIALFFGYGDNLYGCQDIADGLNERFPAAKYRCERTNAP